MSEGSSYHEPQSNIDRLSNLPDSIITHILSFLPTNNAVATSFLAKKWQFHWTNISVLRFSDFNDNNNPRSLPTLLTPARFAQFVSSAFIFLNSKYIDKFILEIRQYEHYYEDISTWISTAIARNFREISVKIHMNNNNNHIIHLPPSLYTSQTLESLSLDGVMSLDIPECVSLPNLTNLMLSRVYYGSDESVRRLISGCSSLLHLEVIRSIKTNESDDVIVFTISSPTLTNLKFVFTKNNWLEVLQKDYRLELDTPSLRSLNLTDDVSRQFGATNLSSLDNAVINLDLSTPYDSPRRFADYGKAVVKLLQTFCNVKHLSLAGEAFKVISREGFSLSYSRLKSLEVSLCEWNSLLYFLDWSKELEEVIFCTDRYPHRRYRESWSKPCKVPVSLSTSLKTMTVGIVAGGEFGILAYVLQNAEVLRKAKFVMLSDFYRTEYTKSAFIQKISELRLGSKECEITLEDRDITHW